jgi:hypothetical protein
MVLTDPMTIGGRLLVQGPLGAGVIGPGEAADSCAGPPAAPWVDDWPPVGAAEAAERGEAAPLFAAAGAEADARAAPLALAPPAVDPPTWGAEVAADPAALGAPGVAAGSTPGAAAGVVAALPFESVEAAGALTADAAL